MSYSPLQLAQAFIQAGELADAVNALTQHLEANPGDDAARRLRAQVYLRMHDEGSFCAALDDLSQLSNPTSDDEITKAITLEYLSDFDGALQVIERVWAGHPNDERIAERYFFMLMGGAKWGEAQSLIATMPPTWDWLEKAGDLASEKKDPKQAVIYYTQALENLETQFDTSIDAFARSLKSHTLTKRARSYLMLERFADADADYGTAEALIPDDPTFTFQRSLIAVELRDYERAIALCHAAFEKANDVWREEKILLFRVMPIQSSYSILAKAILSRWAE